MTVAPAVPNPVKPQYVWQTCLDIESQDADHYGDFVHRPLLDLVAGTPRSVLELGCARGALGEALKKRYPGARVTGIEPGKAAAASAASRIDRVIASRLEDLDFNQVFQKSEFDLAIAADVLEHVVNPWDVLVRLKPFLAPGAQLVASVPNVRNAVLTATLMDRGLWTYAERGLLDITHVRFFTLASIKEMLEETGYRYEGFAAMISPGLIETWRANMDAAGPVTLRFGRMTLGGLSRDELREMCAEQFLVSARPA